MKKQVLKGRLRYAEESLQRERTTFAEVRQQRDTMVDQLRALTAEVEQMRAHWRPVPISHEWQPRNPQCALCDEPRDSVRHQAAP